MESKDDALTLWTIESIETIKIVSPGNLISSYNQDITVTVTAAATGLVAARNILKESKNEK